MQIPPLSDGYYAVFLEDFRRNIRLGVTEEERVAQPVRMDIVAFVKRLGLTDGIESVVDYRHLRDAAIALTDAQHFGLQETLCESLIGQLHEHPAIAGVMIETRKVAIFDDAGAAGCHMAAIDDGVLAR